MTEQQLQTKIKKKLESQGYYVINLIKTDKSGIADLLALKDKETPMFVEVKKPKGGVISELQKYRIDKQRELGFKAFVTNNINLTPIY